MKPPCRVSGASGLRGLRRLLAATAAGCAMATASAAPPDAAVASRLGAAVADAALSELRGGFWSVDGRVSIAVGLRQTVAIDDLPAAAVAGNAATGLVLQNTLSGRQLQVQRVLDVSVDSLQRLQGIALQRDVVNGLVASLRR